LALRRLARTLVLDFFGFDFVIGISWW